MTEIILLSKLENKHYITKTIKETLTAFEIENRIKILKIRINKKLKNDINVDYSKLRGGEVTIEFGSKNKITRKSIYHELGHVWDAIKNNLDFSRIKLTKKQQLIGGIIINLSLDGRLKRLGFPYYSKKTRLKEFNNINKKFNLGIKMNEMERLWGIELDIKKTIKLIKQFGG